SHRHTAQYLIPTQLEHTYTQSRFSHPVRAHTHTHIQTHTNTLVHTLLHTHKFTHTHTRTHASTNTRTITHKNTHTHTTTHKPHADLLPDQPFKQIEHTTGE